MYIGAGGLCLRSCVWLLPYVDLSYFNRGIVFVMSQHAFRVAKQVPVQQTSPPRVKRNRQALSCLDCRARKLKCDRQSPCATCLRKGHGETCIYIEVNNASLERVNGGRPQHAPKSKGIEAQHRLQKLESIVANLLQSQPNSAEPLPGVSSAATLDRDDELSGDRCPVGRLNINGSETSYIGATHWASVLDDVGVSMHALRVICC